MIYLYDLEKHKYYADKIFPFVVPVIAGAGCATSQYGSEATAVLEEGEPSIADTTFLYNSRVIALETKDDALIARVNRLIEWKGNLYILDKAGKQVVAFNMDGKHLFTIHPGWDGAGRV